MILENEEKKSDEFNLEQDKNNVIYLTNNKDLNYFSKYSLNFSSICKSYLQYDCENEDGLRITAINSHMVRMITGMCGLAWSK